VPLIRCLVTPRPPPLATNSYAPARAVPSPCPAASSLVCRPPALNHDPHPASGLIVFQWRVHIPRLIVLRGRLSHFITFCKMFNTEFCHTVSFKVFFAPFTKKSSPDRTSAPTLSPPFHSRLTDVVVHRSINLVLLACFLKLNFVEGRMTGSSARPLM
jgi:hypothetical protein